MLNRTSGDLDTLEEFDALVRATASGSAMVINYFSSIMDSKRYGATTNFDSVIVAWKL